MSEEDILKIVILGEGRVGKTSILSKYFNKKFNAKEQSTINPSFYEKKVNHNGKIVQLKFWDTAGQEQFDAISKIYYQNAVGALLVYDVTIFETFQKVEKWVNTLQEVVGKDITFLIAGNKFDLADKQSLEKHSSSIDSYCNKEHCKHIYTSAKTGYQVDEAFESLINSVVSKVSTAPKQKKKKIEISSSNVEVQKEKKGCC
jgi:Ras-related protein Rab-21